jgi:hypothetical protein
MTPSVNTAEKATQMWRDAIVYYERSVTREGFEPHRPLLDFVRQVADSAYAPEVLSWIGMGALSFVPRFGVLEPGRKTYAGAGLTVTDHGQLDFHMRQYPSGRKLLRRKCEPAEAMSVFASILLRLTLDPGGNG